MRTFLFALLFSSVAVAQGPPPIRGFTGSSAAAERAAEQTFQAIPKPDNLRDYMRTITAEPHHAGSPNSKKVADYVLEKFRSWGLDARIEEFEALMPFPTERVVELIGPDGYVAKLQEPPVDADPDSADAGQLPSFNAYSADGDVTADLVYVNYGIPEDYEQLAKLGLDVKGKIVIARYGRSWRGIKPRVAWEHGAVGCIIYSDPRDDGYFPGDVFPTGAFRPEQGVQRGSVMDMPIYPGDPLTPGWASEAGGKKLSREESKTLLKIPVLPISYGDALPLLRSLRGPLAPEAWRGALPLTYHVGAGASKVHLKLAFDWRQRPLFNVIARIPGAQYPDEWIIHGNHHDAWVNGASDPTSGNVALMETARGLAELLKTGWKPKRTIIIASWDGEEWGLLGSTEWVEKHQQELAAKAVAYINSDGTGKGWLGMDGSHSLQTFINEVARDVPDPRGSGKSVLEAKRERELSQARTDAAKARLKTGDLAIDALGSGSDYTAFLDHLTIASLNLGFGGDGQSGGVYHSVYDSFYWYTHFSDGDFTHTAALSRVIGTALMRLASADILPFEFGSTATTLSGYVDEIQKLATDGSASLDLKPLRKSIASLREAAGKYESALGKVRQSDLTADASLAELNRTLYSTERAFRHEAGLPRRDWFKHLAYAPGFYTGYGVKTLPGIREALEQKQLEEARQFVPIVSAAVDRLRGDVETATTLVGRLPRK
ncbi:MAG: transferrin receptor-like dimerization domain-containing protein [Vicinamibacterales bacterium]